MGEVLAVHGGHVTGEPDKDIIKELEELLAKAKSGDLIGFAYAEVLSNQDQGTGWCGVAGTRHPMGTAIDILQLRYVQAMMAKGGYQ